MPTFTFTGKDASGAAVKGERVAESKDALKAALRKERITATGVKEKGKEFALPKIGGGKVPTKDVAIFFRQFSVMIEAGETGGILDLILQRLAAYVEKAVKLKAAVKSAMIYPCSVIGIAVLVVGALLKFVVPIFASLFVGLGFDLPLPTRIVIGLSNFIGRFWWVFFAGGGLLVFGIKQIRKDPKGRSLLDKMMRNLPVLGMLLRKIAVARFTRTLGTLMTSGVPIIEG